eukprot:scaffold2294_cov106-Cylindrotheca_fusiformis.AAC.18
MVIWITIPNPKQKTEASGSVPFPCRIPARSNIPFTMHFQGWKSLKLVLGAASYFYHQCHWVVFSQIMQFQTYIKDMPHVPLLSTSVAMTYPTISILYLPWWPKWTWNPLGLPARMKGSDAVSTRS